MFSLNRTAPECEFMIRLGIEINGGCGRPNRHCEEPTGRANARPMTGSATKQSILPLRGEMDCFASLAMTRNPDTPSPSRRDAPEALLESSAQGGRGERRMPNAPAASCALGIDKKHTSNNEYTGITRRSRTQWF
jgi:hypothetical protein